MGPVKGYDISVLKDNSRLPDIYKLRVEAWEASKSFNIINSNKYPQGFKDEFDEESIHLIATDIGNNTIMSACRVTKFSNLSRYPYIGLEEIDNFPKADFSLIGRGVRNINFKHKRLQYDFVSLAIQISKMEGLKFATGHAYDENLYMQSLMLDLGFEFSCNLTLQNYRNPDIAFPGKIFVLDLGNHK